MNYAIVTGSTAGIGLAVAKKLLDKGCFVFLNYAHSDERAKAAAAGLEKYREMFQVIKADLSSIKGAETLIKSALERTDSIDYLVLNSYVTDKTAFKDVTPEAWRNVMQTNVDVPFFIMQKSFDNMKRGGSVACIGAMMGVYPHAISVSYGVSKAALHMLCKSMVKIYAPKDITINAVCPGFAETPAQEKKPFDHRRRVEDKIALKRFANPEEIADMCWCVLKNGYVNGAVIPVDGGYCME